MRREKHFLEGKNIEITRHLGPLPMFRIFSLPNIFKSTSNPTPNPQGFFGPVFLIDIFVVFFWRLAVPVFVPEEI